MRIAVALAWLLLQSGAVPPDQIRDWLREGDISAAESALEEGLQADPENWELLALLGELRMRQQRWGEAQAGLDQALQRAPRRPEPYLLLARLHRLRGNLAAAGETLQLARSRLGDLPQILYELALNSVQESDFVKALAFLKQLPGESAPADYWETLGRVQAALGNFGEAEKAYQQLLELREGSIQVLRNLSGFALKQGNTERAWRYLAEARRFAPNSPDVLYEFARVSLEDGLIGEALGCARVLLLLEPKERSYRVLLARTLMAANEHNQARKELEALLDQDPEDGETHLLLAVSLNRLGEFEPAENHARKAAELMQDNTEALYIQGLIAYNRTADEAAESFLTEVLSRKPEHGGAWLALGKLRQRRQEWTHARQALKEAARLLPDDADVQFQLSRVHRQLGESEEARAAVQRYRELKQLQEERDIRAASLPFSRPDPP